MTGLVVVAAVILVAFVLLAAGVGALVYDLTRDKSNRSIGDDD